MEYEKRVNLDGVQRIDIGGKVYKRCMMFDHELKKIVRLAVIEGLKIEVYYYIPDPNGRSKHYTGYLFDREFE